MGKREEEEKKKKEKEEAEAREKQKQEFERKRQIEIERQLARQREIRMQAQEEKKRAEQQRLAARQEMERQRLAEYEKQRKAELTQQRQREQEKVLELKAKKESLDSEFEAMSDKVQKLTNDISETRTGVTDVKCFIDGMRTSRDTKMKDLADLKAKLKDQNQRLIQVTQDKARLEAKNKARQSEVEKGNEDELSEFEIKKQEKEKRVEELREKLSDLKAKEEEKKAKYNEEKEALEDHKQKLKDIIDACKLLYDNFDEKRREVKAEKAKRIRELTDPDHAWDTHEEEPAPVPVVAASVDISGGKDHIEYRALYDFDSSNPDELPFKSGDIIIVQPGQPHEPGWLGGELNGKVGWFPEAYVELADAASDPSAATLQPIAEESAASSLTSNMTEKTDLKMARALYDWTKEDDKDQMTLTKGQQVIVTSVDDANWWYGKMQDNSSQGYFPANFVTTDALEARGDTPTEPPEVIGAPPEKSSSATESKALTCVALFDYVSDEPGDLSFQAGETIIIVKKEEDWCTGKIGDRMCVFPFNYVEVTSEASASSPAVQEQDPKVNEAELPSASEPLKDENNTDDQEIKAIEPSNPVISSIQEDPIKPVTPVTFPESGTESEVSLARNTSLA